MSIDCKIGAVTVTGLGLVLALVSMNLFTPQASATLEDRPFDCPNGTPEGQLCCPPNRDEPRD